MHNLKPLSKRQVAKLRLGRAVSPCLETLEQRRLLNGALELWVNDTWRPLTESNEPLSVGDVVQNTGHNDSGPVMNRTFGVDAFSSITAAMDAAGSGAVVHILAGTYEEQLSVTKSLTLQGQSASNTVIMPVTSDVQSVVWVQAPNVAIRMITISGGSLQGGPDGGPTTVGIDVDGGNVAIHRATVTGNDIGVRVRNSGNVTQMDENFVTNNTVALEVQSTAGTISAVFNNDLSGGAAAITNASAGTVNASGNYFGVTTQAAVAALNTVLNVDFTPWLESGADTAPGTTGFQGDFDTLNVGSAGQQTGADGRIQEGINLVNASGTVFVHSGTYTESDINVNKAVLIDGVGSPSSAIVAPAVADGHLTAPGSVFNALTHNAFVIRSGDVTIKDLTIDGDAGVGGPGSRNFFGGIVTDFNAGSFSNLQAKNLTVQNLWNTGIYFDGGINALTTGNTVMDNTVMNIDGGGSPTGILVLQASGVVMDNNVSDVETGIGVNQVDFGPYAPTVHIRGNMLSDVSVGMNLGALASGSLIGGPSAAETNTIDLTAGPGLDDVGIVFQFPNAAVSIQNNVITASARDAGIWIFATSAANAPLITGNTITGDGAFAAPVNPGDSAGIWLTDNGTNFATSTQATHATISGNSISGFNAGLELARDAAGTGAAVEATVNSNNSISGNSTGIVVFDANGTTPANATIIVSGNSASINGNAVGIDVNGGSATIENNHIYDNGIGVRVRNGGTASLDNNNFDGGANPDNLTDLQLISSPGTVTVGATTANSFAGDTFYIDNLSTQNIDATNNTFDEASNFRIEDKMHHRVDTDLLLSNGLVTWVTGNLYITDPAGVGTTDSTIQRGIDAASSGDRVNIEGGTYAENVTVNKSIILDGDGSGPVPVVTWTASNTSPLVNITTTTTTDDVTILDIAFDGLNGAIQAGDGVRAFAPANFNALTIDRSTFTRFSFDAIAVTGHAVTGISARDVIVTNSSFNNNGTGGGGGAGDISLFTYNGDVSFTNLDLVGTATPTTGARLAIQLRGTGDTAGVGAQPMGTVSFDDVDISGNYRTQFIGFQRYTNVNNLSFNNVKLGGATSEITGTFGAGLRFDAVGHGSLASPASVDLGNTLFRGLAGSSAQPHELEFAPDNSHTFLRADATGTSWTIGGSDIGAGALTLSQAFNVEDRILHFVDKLHPTHGITFGPYKGFAELQPNKSFITDQPDAGLIGDGSITRGADVVPSGGTVHVAPGTYDQLVEVNNSVTIEGAQACVDARGRVGAESVITPPGANETFALVYVTAANVTIDGLTVDGNGPMGGGVLLLDGLTDSNAARGILVDGANAQILNNRVTNMYRRGVQFGFNVSPIGGSVFQNEFERIGADDTLGGANAGFAVLSFSDASVIDNDVLEVHNGIYFIQVYSPNVTPIVISGNDVDARDLGLALNETSSAIPTITISNNTVTTGDNGVGLLLWTVDGTASITGNTFAGTGVGDTGLYAWDGTANDAMNVTVTGGSFTGYATGAHLTNQEATFGSSLNDATLTLSGVTIASAAGGTGMLVEDAGVSSFSVHVNVNSDSDISTGGTGTGVHVDGADASATISGNLMSIGGNSVGIDVDGGSATITNNTIGGNDTGVRVHNSGVALLQGNDLNGNTIGVLIDTDGRVDLGQTAPGTNFTGLGISTGGNDFSGYTTTATTTSGAIVNLKTNPPNDDPGRQGLPHDVPAFNNTWAVNTPAGIENVIYHDVDDTTRGFVEYAVFGGLMVTVTDNSIDEGGTTTVDGSFTNVATAHTVTIDWGDGSPNTVVNLLPGVTSFSIPSPAGVTYTDDPDGPVNSIAHTLTVTVEEDSTNDTLTDSSLMVTVNNVAPIIDVMGAATVNEGSVYTLTLGTVVDPGDDTVFRYIINWGDGNFLDIVGDPDNTMHMHTYSDGPALRNITVSLFDEDGSPHANTGNPDPFTVSVLNVAPTATFFNGGPVPEGINGLVGFASQFDPSGPDTLAGFVYSYDFDNNGVFELSDVPNASVGVPAIYLADGPGMRTVRGRIKDKDGGFTDYTTTITIFNVTPSVNAGPDINVPASVQFTQNGNFSDPGADSPWVGKVDYDFNPGDLITDPDVENLPLSGFNFTLMRTYNTPGTYTIRVYVTDKDGATGTDDVIVNVGPVPTFQVSQFLTNTSGFTLKFNRAAELSVLNLYDGLDGFTPSADPADLTLVGNFVGSVKGSLVWDASTNTATFVKTGGPLLPDTYTLTVRSAGDAWQDTFGALLDGNADNTPGDNFSTSFVVPSLVQRTLSVPDFARGPDAANDINVPNTSALGLPVRLDDGSQVRSVDFTIHYNPALLSITGAQKGAGLPSDWSITSNLTTPGVAIITVFGTSSDLSPGPHNLVKLIANVPNSAPYTAAHAMRIQNITISRNDASTIASRGDSAIHKVVYFGDVDADRQYTGFDAALVSRVVVGLDTGYHELQLVDPVIVSDIDNSGHLTGIDASFVAQKAALLPRPEIPDLPGVLPPLVGGGVDPFISMPMNKLGSPGNTTVMPLSIDDAENTMGFNVTVDYDTNLLDVLDNDAMGMTPAVYLGGLYDSAGGWSLTTNVDDAAGRVTLVFWRSSGVPMPAGSGGGVIANVEFDVKPGVPDGTVIPITVGGTQSVGGLVFTHGNGSILIDAVSPFIAAENFVYQTAPHKLTFQFSEDVADSLEAGDFVVHNVTTNTTIPSNQFTLTYNNGTDTATLTYIGNVLDDGDYTVTISPGSISDEAGNDLGAHQFDFFFLMADANHDRFVNLDDFNILAANFGASPRDFTQGDFTYDGVVNLDDFNILASRFGAALGSSGQMVPPTGGAPKAPTRGMSGDSKSTGTSGAGSTASGSGSLTDSGKAPADEEPSGPDSAGTGTSGATETASVGTTGGSMESVGTSPFSTEPLSDPSDTSSTESVEELVDVAVSPTTSPFAGTPIGRTRGLVE